ncbi:MAG TPA: hypothetical protein VK997_10870 [Deferrisomatales bacterium]|nr:hypothetical protein [Deferrisomatales bacterium]
MDTLTQPRDVVLVYVDDEPTFYARVEEILLDRKSGWRQLRFQVLTLPPQELTWILEPNQIDGDTFTMGGTPVRIERLPEPRPSVDPETGEAIKEPQQAPQTPGEVISFPPRKG